MAIRGVIKDILTVYVTIILLIKWISRQYIPYNIAILVILLGATSVWFLLERLGIVPKFSF